MVDLHLPAESVRCANILGGELRNRHVGYVGMVTSRGVVSNPDDAQRLDIVPGAAGVRAPLKAHGDLDVRDLAQEPIRDVRSR